MRYLRNACIWFTCLCLCVPFGAADDTESTQQSRVALSAKYLYNGVNRPVPIEIRSDQSLGSITLVLTDFQGAPLAPAVEVSAGEIDLAQQMPSIWQLRRTGYLQVVEENQPIGSALVLQPMLSRLVPITETRPHPVSGKPHSRIIGWRDENAPLPPLENEAIDRSQPPSGAAPSAEAEPTIAEPIAPVFSGLRIYPERDVILHTTHGDIRIALQSDEAPNTVWNFLELCQGGFFRDVQFHRIVPLTNQGHPFVIQAGDPTASGDGGPGYWLPIENSRLPHDFGVISMARADDPDSNGSQFFFCLSREGTARLDGQYCSFGYAVEGAQAILSIALVPLADIKEGRAADPPMIESAELVPAPPRELKKGRPDRRISMDDVSPPRKPSGHIPR